MWSVPNMKQPWKALYSVFTVFSIIGLGILIPDVTNVSIVKDGLDSMTGNMEFIAVILRLNGALAPAELVIALFSYLMGKPDSI